LWLSFLYSLTFGGFVGFASFLTVFFHEQYDVSRIMAGDFTTVVVVAGSLLRPLGGWLSDRLGGYRLLVGVLGGVGCLLALLAMLPPVSLAIMLLFLVMGLLGIGNGAVFQLVPLRFPAEVGLLTGVIGAAGGLGGFMLPTLLGAARDATGTYATGLIIFAMATLAATVALLEVGRSWSTSWTTMARAQAGLFAYRSVRAAGFVTNEEAGS
jgi:NNP family nitrate/nitrite transporter-like MFS transporter